MHLGAMTPDVTLLAALLAGLVSFLSPCVLPLVPPYLVYLAGTSLERLTDDDPKTGSIRETVLAAFLFVCGFSTVFVALGASASVIGALIRTYSAELSIVAGIAIIVMGLHFLGVLRIGVLLREKRMEMAKPVGLWGAYAMGLAFAFGWTPCIGPILAAILAVAASEQTVAKGAGLLAVYSLGFGIPFLLAAVRGRAVRGVPGALSPPSRPGRARDGRPAGADRHRLPDRLRLAGELLAVGGVSGTRPHRLNAPFQFALIFPQIRNRNPEWLILSGRSCGSSLP